MYVPCGLGIFSAFLVLDFCIICRISEINKIIGIFFLIVPFIMGISYNLLSKKFFLKITRGNTVKAEQYAKDTDSIFYIIAIIAVAILYNLGFFAWDSLTDKF